MPNITKFNSGEIYGTYEIIERDTQKISPHAYWKCKCIYCGNIKSIRSQNLKNGNFITCKCQQKLEMIGKIYNNFEVISKTNKHTNNKTIIYLCKCIHCGHILEIDAAEIRKERKLCPKCQERRSTLIDMTNDIYGYLKVLKRDTNEKYMGHENDSYWICQCLNCGTIKSIRGISLRNGVTKSCGCIKSYGEKTISEILTQNNIIFEKEYSFKDLIYKQPLRFDFAIFNKDGSLSHLVEYDGIQHFQYKNNGWNNEQNFKLIQLRDNLKNKYCKDNNIKLIRISYNEKITLERIMGNEFDHSSTTRA